MDSPVQKIKERLSIEEVVSSYLKLERAGANLKAKCPFHNEKTPSFFVSPSRGSYYCFGCGASGDIFSFVEEFEGLDFKGTLKLLADRAGVSLSEYNSQQSRETASEKDKLHRIVSEAASFFEANLAKNPKVSEYLKSRGLTSETIKNFRIGFALPDWRTLYDFLVAKGFSESDMEKAGLVKKNEGRVYDRFRSRIMFPISDSGGRIIAFSGRIFGPEGEDEKTAKYINSPETPIFDKSSVLYGIDRAKESIRKNNFSILVEGQMDLVLSHQAGFRNTVASSGTALSEETVSKENIVSNLGLVRRLSQNIVLAFDADSAGERAAGRAGRIALSLGMDVKVAHLPLGVDPAELIAKNGPEAWREAIRKSRHLIEFLLSRVLERHGGDARKAGREIKEKILPFVAAIESEIEQSHFLKLLSDQSGIPEEALVGDMKKVATSFEKEQKEFANVLESENKLFRKDHIRKKLLGIVLWQKTRSEPEVDVEEILRALGEIYQVPAEQLLVDLRGETGDLIFEAEVFYQAGADISKDTEELLDNLRAEHWKEDLEQKMILLRRAESDKDAKLSVALLKECQELGAKIQNIKNKNFK